MCGICGYVPAANHDGLLKTMTDLIAHRGPDDHGYFQTEDCALGHRRLSIIDLEGGQQPMSTPSQDTWVVFNGEIYNFQSLRNELEGLGHTFKTQSDTEVILRSFVEWQDDCFQRFNGIFAIALWDDQHKRLVLARDHIGIKPLYYTVAKDTLYFASEVKSLLAVPSLPRNIDERVLCRYLLFNWNLGQDSLIAGIRQVDPGTYVVWDNSTVRVQRYWSLRHKEVMRPLPEVHASIRRQLRTAVSDQLVSDVPLGMTLSGGLDSSAIVASYRTITDQPMHTFCIGCGAEDDELPAAERVAQYLHTDHHPGTVTLDDMTQALPRIYWHLEDPSCCYTAIMVYFLSRMVREQVKVCLIGEGSDELFGGYTRYKIFSHRWQWLPLKPRVDFYLSPGHFGFKPAELPSVSPLISKSLVREIIEREYRPYFMNGSSALNGALRFDVQNELPNHQLMRIDKVTMAHGLEARVPFLEHNLVQYAMSIPAAQKMPTHREKPILRDAMASLLPPETVNRRKGASQYILAPWIQHHLQHAARYVFQDSQLVSAGIVAQQTIKDALPKALQTRRRIARRVAEIQLFNLFALEVWHRLFIDRQPPEQLDLIAGGPS